MKGKILDFNIQSSLGVITGDDGKRYNFSSSEWKSEKTPSVNQIVDFEVDTDNAVGIYLDKAPMSIDTDAIKEEILNIADSQIVKNTQDKVKKILDNGAQNLQGFVVSITLAIFFFFDLYDFKSKRGFYIISESMIDGLFGSFLLIMVLVVVAVYYTGIKKELIKIVVGISGFFLLISFYKNISLVFSNGLRYLGELNITAYIVLVLIIAYILIGFKSKFKGQK